MAKQLGTTQWIVAKSAVIRLDHTELEDRNTAIAAHVHFKNKSSVAATNFHGVFHLDTVETEKADHTFERYPARLALERAFLAADAESDLHKKIDPERRSLGPQETLWGTACLTTDQRLRRQLHSGDRVVMARTFYSDQTGEHSGQICRWLQPPADLQSPVWHLAVSTTASNESHSPKKMIGGSGQKVQERYSF